jgi:hypothetical protein
LGEGIVDAFSQPKKLLSDLLDFMEGQVMNRIKAFGTIWEGIWEGDFDKVGDGILTVGTGITDLTGKIKTMASETNDFLDEAWKRGKRIADLDVQISTAKMTQAYASAKLTRLLKEQELISKDTTKSEAERAKAVEYASQLSKQKLMLEKHLLDLQKEKMLAEQKSNDTSREEKQKYFELLAKEEEFKTKMQKDEMKFLGVKNQLAKSAEKERAKAVKDANKRVLDNIKIEIETYIAKNKKILESDKELNNETFNARLRVLSEINRLEKTEIERKKKFGILKENEYKLEMLNLENEYQAQLDDLKKQWSDKQTADAQIKKEQARQQKQIDLELELMDLEMSENAKYEKKAEINAIHKEQELMKLQADLEAENLTIEQAEKKKQLIEQKYRNQSAKDEQNLANIKAKIKQKEITQAQQSAHQVANIANTLFGESKAVSGAMALVDTYVATQKAYTSQLVPGDPSSVVRATLAGASALASGLANVKSILSASKGGGASGASGGGGAGIPSFSRPTSAVQPVQSQTPQTAQPQASTFNAGQTTQTVRVVNVARDTADVFTNEILTENFAND